MEMNLNYIITYEGSKDSFMNEYKQTLDYFGCNITDHVQAGEQTILFMQYQGKQPEKLEDKLSELGQGNLHIERDIKRNLIPENPYSNGPES